MICLCVAQYTVNLTLPWVLVLISKCAIVLVVGSQEDLKKAKITPAEYKNLRVRVSGFSDFFVNLTDSIQDEIIERTVKNK